MRLRPVTAAWALGAAGLFASPALAEPAAAPPGAQPEVRPLPEIRPLPPGLPPGRRDVIFVRRQVPGVAFAEKGPARFALAADGPEARTEKGAYLGVSTSPAPQVLRRQLQLPNGVGLVVDFVPEKSPAAAAGMKQFDVLHKLNDQVLVNQQQLAVLVRGFKPGDEVKLTVLREGKPQVLTVKLVEHDLPPLDDMRFGDGEHFDRFLLDRLAGEGGAGGFGPPGRPLNPWDGDVLVRRPDARLLADAMKLVWSDGKVTLTLTNREGKRHLAAVDSDGKTLFDGPVETEEQRNALPKDVRERLEKAPLPKSVWPAGPPGGGGGPTTRPGNEGKSGGSDAKEKRAAPSDGGSAERARDGA